MICNYFNNEDCERIFAEDQSWDKETLKQLQNEYNVYFMNNGDGVCPIKIIPRNDAQNPLIAIGWEDDGQIGFDKYDQDHYTNCIDAYWIDSLIADLLASKKAIGKIYI